MGVSTPSEGCLKPPSTEERFWTEKLGLLWMSPVETTISIQTGPLGSKGWSLNGSLKGSNRALFSLKSSPHMIGKEHGMDVRVILLFLPRIRTWKLVLADTRGFSFLKFWRKSDPLFERITFWFEFEEPVPFCLKLEFWIDFSTILFFPLFLLVNSFSRRNSFPLKFLSWIFLITVVSLGTSFEI